MKRLLILPVLLLALFAHAQEKATGDSSVDYMTNWIKDDFRTYTIRHDKSTTRDGQPGPNFHLLYEARVSVLDATEKGYTVKWVFHLPESTKSAHPGGADSIPILDGMQMIFQISETGTFMGLINWEEVRDVYARLLKLNKDDFSTRQSVESALIKEIQLYHQPYGYTFTTAKVSSNTKLSNPFGGDPLPAVQSYQITELDPGQDGFTLVIRQQTDAPPKTSTKPTHSVPPFEMSDYSEYKVIRSSGWLRHLYYKRTSASGGFSQSDSYTFELKD